MKLSIYIVGDPKGQPRARWASRRLPETNRQRGYIYNPTTANGWRYPVTLGMAKLAEEAGHPLKGPLRMDLTFFFERPRTHWVRSDMFRRISRTAPVYHDYKPDLDNLIKLIMDCATNASVWGDDDQVAELTCRKRFATHEPPGCLIVIDDELGDNVISSLYSEDMLDLGAHPRRAPGACYATSSTMTQLSFEKNVNTNNIKTF